MRLNERSSLSASASYSRSGEPLGAVNNPALFSPRNEFVNVRADYDRSIGRRLSAFASLGAARAYGDRFVRREANYEARAGLRVRFGAGL